MTLKTIEDYEKAIAESDNRLAELEEKLNEAYAQQDAKNTERAKALLKHLVTHKVLAYFDNHLTLTNPVNGNNVLSFTLPTNGSARMYTIEHIVRDQSFENNLKVLTTLIETIKRLHNLWPNEETLKGFHAQTTYHLVSDWMTIKLERGNTTLTLKSFLLKTGQDLHKVRAGLDKLIHISSNRPSIVKDMADWYYDKLMEKSLNNFLLDTNYGLDVLNDITERVTYVIQ